METNAGRYSILHDLVIVLGYLAIMLTLDVIYGSLLLDAFTRKALAAHRERAAARRLQQKIAAVSAATPISASAASISDMTPDMTSDMQQAA